MEPLIIPTRPLLLFLVVLARVGGLVSFAPFWSNRAAAPRVRTTLALVLALALTPAVMPRMETPPSDPLGLAVVLIGELVIGCAFGLVGRLIFSALEMAAFVLGFQLGLSLSSTIDPATRAQTTALGTAAQMFGLLVLLGADGHYWLLIATVKSFDTIAPGGTGVSHALAQLLLRLSADALAVGLALAAPAIVVLLAVEFLLALAGRAAPQLQVMLLGFPIKMLAGLWLLGAALYFLPGALRNAFNTFQSGLGQALKSLGV
jgi:flagellar biosynthesis protein FliR